MKIDTSTIQDGSSNGKTVWICHYNRPDLHKKPLRNVPPTKVLVVSNDELPDNKRIYYSKSHFRPFSKSGKTLTRKISPVDNTGYRACQGNPLHVFDNEQECIDAWNKQLSDHIVLVNYEIATAASYWENERTKLSEMIKDK